MSLDMLVNLANQREHYGRPYCKRIPAEQRDQMILDYLSINQGSTLDQINEAFPQYARRTLKNVLQSLRDDGRVTSTLLDRTHGNNCVLFWPAADGV